MAKENKNDVCVLFSGGTDSSLVSYRSSFEFDTVHLLTFTHSFHFDIEKSEIMYNFLNEKLPGKFKHVLIDVDDMLLKIHKKNLFKNLVKYKSINLIFGCFACQACFHLNTIIYCLKNDIHHVRDGANTEYGEYSPMQIKIVIDEIDKLYTAYGIIHTSPVYHEHDHVRSDHQLFDLGIVPERNIKDNMNTYLKYQGLCKLGSCSAVSLYYLKRCQGYPYTVQKKIREHWIEEVPFFKSIIEENI